MAARTLGAALVAAMLLAGCSGGSDDSNDGGGDGNTTAPPPTPPAAPPSAPPAPPSAPPAPPAPPEPRDPVTWEKDVEDNDFPEGAFTVQVGDTVTWTHRGTNPHSVTSTGSFDSHPNCPPLCLLAGQSFPHTFDEVGEFDYHCKVHTGMTGTVTVLEAYNGTPPA